MAPWVRGGKNHLTQAIARKMEVSPAEADDLTRRAIKVLGNTGGAVLIGEDLQPGTPAVHVRRGKTEVRLERRTQGFHVQRVAYGSRPPDEHFGYELPDKPSRSQLREHVGKDRRVKTQWGPMQFYAGDDAGPYVKLPDDRVMAAATDEELTEKLHAELERP